MTNEFDDEDKRAQERLYRERIIYERKAQNAERDESPRMAAHYRSLARGCRKRAISEERGSW